MLKIRCTDVQNPTTENSYSTEYQKAKFHSPYILNEERNRVRYNSVNEIPSDLVIQTNRILPLCLILYFQKERRKTQKLWKMHLQKNLHLHSHWRQSKSDHTLQEQGSQHARTLGNEPVHIVTFTCEMLSQPGSVDTQYNVLTLQKLVNKLFRLFCTMDTHIYRVIKVNCNFFQDH